jgi:hypothetical protein
MRRFREVQDQRIVQPAYDTVTACNDPRGAQPSWLGEPGALGPQPKAKPRGHDLNIRYFAEIAQSLFFFISPRAL